jgi:predicted metal-binding membrane protein
MVVRALGLLFITLEMQLPPLAHAVPLATGAIVLLAGMYQFSTWKAHYLARCRTPWPGDKVVAATAIDAWRYGLRLGMHCIGSCVGLTAILLVAGVMDLRAMVVVTGAISLERLARHGQCAARAIGTVSISAGLFLVVRAAWLG